jgi:hypothetical protein
MVQIYGARTKVCYSLTCYSFLDFVLHLIFDEMRRFGSRIYFRNAELRQKLDEGQIPNEEYCVSGIWGT